MSDHFVEQESESWVTDSLKAGSGALGWARGLGLQNMKFKRNQRKNINKGQNHYLIFSDGEPGLISPTDHHGITERGLVIPGCESVILGPRPTRSHFPSSSLGLPEAQLRHISTTGRAVPPKAWLLRLKNESGCGRGCHLARPWRSPTGRQ